MERAALYADPLWQVLLLVTTLFLPLIYMPLSWFSAAQRQGMMGRGRITSPL